MSFTILALFGGIPSVAMGAFLLTEALRDGRRRLWLALAIPGLFAWPFAIWGLGSGLLGYATDSALAPDFRLIHSFADDKQQVVYALVLPKDAHEPRFYKVEGNYEANRKAFAQAQQGVGKGLPMAGKPGANANKNGNKPGGAGSDSDGAFVFYVLPPANIPPKDPQ